MCISLFSERNEKIENMAGGWNMDRISSLALYFTLVCCQVMGQGRRHCLVFFVHFTLVGNVN